MADNSPSELMTTAVGLLVIEAVKKETAALAARVDGLAVEVQALKDRGTTPGTTPAPGPATPPATDPASPTGTRITEGGSLRWKAPDGKLSTWSISGGKILRDGQSTAEVSLTANVQWLQVTASTLVHASADATVWAYTGQPNWQRVALPTIGGEARL